MSQRVESIRGLTLWQPMAWAIAAGHKRIENRPWKPWKNVTHLAIHAGAKYHADHARQITEHIGIEVPPRSELVFGAIIAVARLAGYITGGDQFPTQHHHDPWFSGPFGWLLDEVAALDEPVPCKGHLGLWNLQPEDLDALHKQGAIYDWRERA